MTATAILPTPEMLIPYIRAADARVGQRRTDVADVARILSEFGTGSTMAMNAVRDAIAATFPPEPAIDQQALSRVAQMQRNHEVYLPSWAYIWEGISEYRVACAIDEAYWAVPGTAENDERTRQIHNAIDAWWDDNRLAIDALCRAEARRLLDERALAERAPDEDTLTTLRRLTQQNMESSR